MVRNYQRTPGAKPYQDYSEENMEKAIQAVGAGMSKKLAAVTYQVPRTTLIRKVLGKNSGAVGRPRVLSAEEEHNISDTLGVVANWGFPLTRLDVRTVIAKYLDKQGKTIKIFKNNTPGEDFLDAFIQRNRLSIRLASNIKRSRASVDREDILNFFTNINEALNDADDFNIYNYDETNVTDDPGAKKVVVPRNTKRVERVQNHSRTSISIMVCGNAKGDLLPPMVVYKSGNLYENWTEGGPPGTKYASSPSGWFDMNLFEMWFFKILLPHIMETRKPGATTIVVGDNLASHFSPAVIKSCKENAIYITPFPANATHLMQPLDVAVFGPMKKCWRKILDNWRKESRYPGNLPKEQFPNLLSRLWNSMSESVSQNLISGFRATGLYPPDPNEVLKRIPDGLIPDDQDTIGRSLDASLVDLLREHRGVGSEANPKKKRGKKVQPGKNLARDEDNGVAPTDEPIVTVPVDLVDPNKTIDSPTTQALDPQHGPGSSGIVGKKKIKRKSRSIQPRKKSERLMKSQTDARCGLCFCNWKDFHGAKDWIKCIQCLKWICGLCNNGSKDPYFKCDYCDDSEASEPLEYQDDSEADKDFMPSD